MSTLRVMLFVEKPTGGGAERNMMRLANGLHAAGLEVVFVTARHRQPHRPAGLHDGVGFHDLGVSHLPMAFTSLVRQVRTRRPDVLISALSAANVIAIAATSFARRHTRVLITERNHPTAQRTDARSFRRRVLTPWLMRRLYRRADAIVGVSEGVADNLARFVDVPRATIQAIPNPVVDVDLEMQANQPLPVSWASRIGDRPLIVNVGRLATHKDHQSLLRAFAQVRDTDARVCLAIVGDGPEQSRITALVASLGIEDSVLLPGYQDNPYPWMRRATVLALTSRYEGLPTVLVEALACGARVVATDCPSGPDEILERGRWGALVPIGDVPAIAQALEDALRAGRWASPPEEALKPYRPEAVTAQYLDVIRKLVPDR